MRRSIVHAIVASFLALTVIGCSDDTTPTGPKGAANAAQLPPPVVFHPPLLPPKPNDFVQIVAGANQTCARKYNNAVYCWGVNNNGQTGVPSTATCPTIFGNGTVLCIDRPTVLRVPVGSGTDTLRATTIDAGVNHACVIDPMSDAYCWGDGTVGQVGSPVGAAGHLTQPTKVAGGLKFSMLSAGTNSTCASGPNGTFCWGRIQGNAASPTFVSSFATQLSLSVGDAHACVVGSGSGGIQCWGDNSFGQLAMDPVTHPTQSYVGLATFNYPSSSVVTESNFTCANETVGMIECVGDNSWGQLGSGSSAISPGIPQAVGGGQALSGVSTGTMHACALDPSYHAWCWGNGISGQLGNGSPGVYNTPQAVSGGRAYRAIAVGGQHTCAIGTDNHIYCWGINNLAQLGAPQFMSGMSSTPVQALDPR